MSEYGVTNTGFVKKRLDVILDEMHDDLSTTFGFNTRNNPKSYLHVLLTNFADKIAELWEVAEESYAAMYPSSAAGASLDSAVSYGGVMREDDARSVYIIDCTGTDGTNLPVAEIRINSDTEQPVYLRNYSGGAITRGSCKTLSLVASGQIHAKNMYTVTIDNKQYTTQADYDGGTTLDDDKNTYTIVDILTVLRDKINTDSGKSYTAAMGADTDSETLIISSEKLMAVSLSNTLTTKWVTSEVQFSTEEFGDICLNFGSVKIINSGVSGLEKVTNTRAYTAGAKRQTDEELRYDYAKKIFIRSRTMLESVESSVLGVQGVSSCVAYQNDTNVYDGHRPPHTLEVVVEGDTGTASQEIAQAIFATKAAGIQTCHKNGIDDSQIDDYSFAVQLTIPKSEGAPDLVTVRFTKPEPFTVNVNISVSMSSSEPLSAYAISIIQRIIEDRFDKQRPGQDVRPQQWLEELYAKVSGVADFDIKVNDSRFITGLQYNKIAAKGEINVRQPI
jgi:uncharacterized phage protein gp47/JayE